MKKILVIDNDELILESIKLIFEDMGHEVAVFSDSRKGLDAALANTYDLLLVDIRMPDLNGAEVTETLLQSKPASKVFVITGFPSDPLVVRALAAGALGLLRKPFEIAKIIDSLQDKP